MKSKKLKITLSRPCLFLPCWEARGGVLFGKIGRSILVLLCCLLSISCSIDNEGEVCDIPKHVLLVYMGGDNNLSAETYQKIEAIRSGWKASAGDRIIIYQDAADAAPTLTEIIKKNGVNTLKTIKTYPEENSASAEVFARVIDEVKALYPLSGGRGAYGLLVFSHASGWLPNGTLVQPKLATQSTAKSIIIDGNDEMNIIDFANAIPDGAFNYIVLEACFMAGIEVAYELKDKTNYILASSAEILSPGFTETYPQTINDLFDNNLTRFGQTSFDYFNNKSGNDRSATFSLIKTSELGVLATFVKDNCNKDKEIILNDIQHFDRYSYRLFFDFGEHYSLLLESDSKKAELSALIDKCVIWKAATEQFLPYSNGFDIRLHSGLTTYIPQERFPYLNSEYAKLKWGKKQMEWADIME